jgi:hypothetical protein
MAEAGETGETAARAAPSRLPLIAGLVLALAGAGGGFHAARSGLLPFGGGRTRRPLPRPRQRAATAARPRARRPRSISAISSMSRSSRW